MNSASTSPPAAPADTGRILVRATTLDERTLRFGDALQTASGLPVVFVIDERRGPGVHHGRPVVGLDDARCAALGLHCPPDYAWRCGDYAYYLARQAFPETASFWMIEYDVRFAGGDPREFFTFFGARPEADLLTTCFGPAGWDWHWAITARGNDVRPMRCLFPVTRLSAIAIDALLAKRVAHSRKVLRRTLWPNDEAMVATTLAHGDFVCRDLNDFGTVWYDPATFSFTVPIDGDAVAPETHGLRIHHPVLYGEQYARKVARLAEAHAPRPRSRAVADRIAAKLNSLTPW